MEGVLSNHQINQFKQEGFIRLERAFSRETAERARSILWNDLPCNPSDPSTWTRPVVRLGMYTQEPFQEAANTTYLHSAFDQLIGPGQWLPCKSMGTFPVRFPSDEDPGDTGWHVEGSFPGINPDNYFEWRINAKSRGRALLMLFLFSDVGEQDAPTKIRTGSHLDVARLLAPAGDDGFSFMELAGKLSTLPRRNELMATGEAGTVYLCHPFIVHSSQPHHGTQPRFMAQPPLLLRDELVLERPDGAYSPLEESIRMGILRSDG